MGRRWDCIHGKKNIHPKQQETQEEDSTRESRLNRHGTSRTIMDARIDQEELLVARTKGRCQEICIRLFQMSTKQSPVLEEVRRTTPIGDSTRIMAGD